MKKVFIFAIVAILTLGLATAAFAAISGSKHDLSFGGAGSNAWAASTQTCVVCHHPHQGDAAGIGGELLWNNTGSNSTAEYTSNTLVASPATVDQASAPESYVCMGCHDDGLAASAVITNPGDNGGANNIAVALNVNATLGTDLSDDHPVNFVYDSTAHTLGEYPVKTVAWPKSLAGGLPIFGTAAATEKVQCATCHDVHNIALPAFTPQFMRITTAASAICKACHLLK